MNSFFNETVGKLDGRIININDSYTSIFDSLLGNNTAVELQQDLLHLWKMTQLYLSALNLTNTTLVDEVSSITTGLLDAFDMNTPSISQNPGDFSNKIGVSTGVPKTVSTYHQSWIFLQGFLVGQLSVVVVLLVFIRFFIFSSGSERNPSYSANMRGSLKSAPHFLTTIMNKRSSRENDLREELEAAKIRKIKTVLEKTYYSVENHTPESLDWFNVLLAQTIVQYREESWQQNKLLRSLNEYIDEKSGDFPDYLSNVRITFLDLGKDFPLLSNCRVRYLPKSNKGSLEARIDIDLNDKLAFGVEAQFILNFPKPKTAALPIHLTISLIRFQACLNIRLTSDEQVDLNDKTENMKIPPESGFGLTFSFAPGYRMEIETQSEIGARSKLENIPKIGSLIEYQIKKWFVERCVEPRFQYVKLPSIWPKKKNTMEKGSDSFR